MKSFIAYPFDFDASVFPQKQQNESSGKFLAHYKLFKKIRNLEGAVIKCGITTEEGFTRFAMFRELISNPEKQKMVAFQKFDTVFEEETDNNGEVILKVRTGNAEVSVEQIVHTLRKKGQNENIEFVPGQVCDSIPEYLIQNPELKISLLSIDLNDYEGTITTLEFFYPRLVQGGVLILDNYHKHNGETKAVSDYFAPGEAEVRGFMVDHGPHYIVKK